MVHTAYTLPAPNGTGCFVATSNGLASGNHLLEATSHAICETVERDAATLHNVVTPAERALQLIDPRTVEDPDCAEALGRLDWAGMSAVIWDITTDIGIPAFKCLIAEGKRYPVPLAGPSVGTGCHPSREVALLRAITEAVQARLAAISGARDEPSVWDDPPGLETECALGQEAELGSRGARPFTAVASSESESFDEDVAWELSALSSAGISEVVAVDLTRDEFAIPVVRIIVPGLEGPTETVPSCRLGRRAMTAISSR